MTFGGVVVSRDRDEVFVCRDRAGHVVLIEAIVVAKQRAIANVETSGLVIDDCRARFTPRSHAAVSRIAEESFDRNIDRSSLKRWNAAIGDAAVVKVFVREFDCSLWTNDESRGWINAITLEVDVVSEAAGVFVNAVQAETRPCRRVADRNPP